MNYQIELYRGVNRVFFGTIPFMPLLRQSLEKLLKLNLSKAFLRISIRNVPEDGWLEGSPTVEHLIPEFGYCQVIVILGGFLIYQHPHPLNEIVTQTLQATLKKQYPEENYWAFRIDIPGMPPLTATRLTPAVEGGFIASPQTQTQKPAFSIRRVTEAEPPSKELADFGLAAGDATLTESVPTAPVIVLLPQTLHNTLCQSRPLSHSIEEGGFLIGKVYRHGDRPNAYLLELTEALSASYTGASLLHLTFTGDSFAEAKRLLRQDHPDDRILGWYHTHLFPATDAFGLSSIDVKLHFTTFTIPWQVAGLINLDGDRRRLRFYVPQGDEMVLCPYQVINECYKHSVERH